MRKATLAAGLTLFSLLASTCVMAEALSSAQVPEPLRPWVDWVLHGQEAARCPFLLDAADQRQCLWPSRLDLTVDDRTGRFSQQWTALDKAWVPLPGDSRVWPQEVKVDGQPAIVVPRNSEPGVEIGTGTHVLAGVFSWDAPPEVVAIPPATGLLALTLRGQQVSFPNRDAQGRLWLQKRAAEEDTESRIDVAVHRHISDDIPLLLTTHVQLKVSGKGREVLLGKALPDQFVPMLIDSPLPARIEKDGWLTVQVRPGVWNLQLTARHDGPVASLTLNAADGPWDPEEVWVFDARPNLRLVSVEGPVAIDPQQTELPAAWKNLPAYLMHPGSTMRFAEKRRGDAEPAPDQLVLKREWWLDFDGGGYTVRDQISGSMNRNWRLEISAPWELGRVGVSGQDQLITRLGQPNVSGIEIHHGQVQVDADSRLTGSVSDTPAVGWLQDFQQVAGQLNLPPGWRLLYATGVDDANATWVSTWSLLDLFVVLITVLAAAKLWGPVAGIVALMALGLTYVEAGAPRAAWLAVLAGEALVRVIPEGRFQPLAKWYQLLALAGLVLVAVPFMVQQVRHGMYPALEIPWVTMGDGGGSRGSGGDEIQPLTAGEPAGQAVPALATPEEEFKKAAPSPTRGGSYDLYSSVSPSRRSIDPKALVQTGPGLPRWSWKQVALRWRGPVERDQRVHFFFLGPRGNLVAAWLRAALLALLGACAFGWRPGARAGGARAILLLPLLGLLAASVPAAARADIPSRELLDELRSRLLAPPDCQPACASSSRMLLEIGRSALRARLDVDVGAETAVPLPGGAQHWLPAAVVVDGRPATALMRSTDGTLWLMLSAGKHQVSIDGPLPDRDTVQVPLPMKPHRVEARAEGWQLDGLHEDGLAEDSLQLTRIQDANRTASAALQQETLPPFVRIERVIQLGLSWQVQTRAERLTPAGSAIVLEVPLLPGEAVTSAGVRVADGKALVTMPAQATEVSWESTLAETDSLSLHAPDGVAWTEVWRLSVSPIWHVQADGIPVVHEPDQRQARLREWRPWPGESVTLRIQRPEGVPGQTFTIDRSIVQVNPGLRSSDVRLDLDIRSSRGAQHALTLPPGAELQSVTINGSTQPIRQENQQVTLPLVPGRQNVQVAWRQRGGIAGRYMTPPVDLGIASVNADVRIAMPADRWALFLDGPRMGPAVLFWSVLAVVLLLAIGLGLLPLTPLRWHQWLLLGVGLTQSPMPISVVVAGWLLALGWRREHGSKAEASHFDVMQVVLIGWTVAALFGLYWSVQQGLLGLPQMQISGNGSHAQLVRWYQDRSGPVLPQAWVISVPLMVYRFAMLAWALWLAQALLRWLRWGWESFATGGLWRPLHRTKQPIVAGK
jgi:hypothetical protein